LTDKKKWFDLYSGNLDSDSIIELPVLSGSMSPLLPIGSMVRIKAASFSQVRFGDIIAFREGGSITMHRLLIRFRLFSKKIVYQKGDANQLGRFITAGSIVGIAIGVIYSNIHKDLTTNEYKNQAKKYSVIQIKKLIANLFLYIPRKIKSVRNK
jgi:signal peptidase I